MTRRHSSSTYADGAADIARRFGITIKTLRHYESAGLITPVRNSQGWRSYGQAECERLHLILLLRRFGLTLARISDMLANSTPDMMAVMEMQERALLDQKTRIDNALSLLARAKAQAAARQPVDPASLAELARTEPLEWRWSADLDEFAARFFDPTQRRHLAETTPELSRQWMEVIAELERLGTSVTPEEREARALGARAAGLISIMTGGDPAFHNALANFWKAGLSNPAYAAKLPLSEEQWHFLGRAMQAYFRSLAA